jgi:hypothetical protein
MGDNNVRSTGALLCIGNGASLAVAFGRTGIIAAAIPVDSPNFELTYYRKLL